MSSTSDEDISKGDTDDQNPMMVNLLASADRLLEIAEHGLTSNRNILDDPGGGFGGEKMMMGAKPKVEFCIRNSNGRFAVR